MSFVYRHLVGLFKDGIGQSQDLYLHNTEQTRNTHTDIRVSGGINTFASSYLNTQGLNNSYLKSPATTLVDLNFQSRALRSFSLNQLRNLSL